MSRLWRRSRTEQQAAECEKSGAEAPSPGLCSGGSVGSFARVGERDSHDGQRSQAHLALALKIPRRCASANSIAMTDNGQAHLAPRPSPLNKALPSPLKAPRPSAPPSPLRRRRDSHDGQRSPAHLAPRPRPSPLAPRPSPLAPALALAAALGERDSHDRQRSPSSSRPSPLAPRPKSPSPLAPRPSPSAGVGERDSMTDNVVKLISPRPSPSP